MFEELTLRQLLLISLVVGLPTVGLYLWCITLEGFRNANELFIPAILLTIFVCGVLWVTNV